MIVRIHKAGLQGVVVDVCHGFFCLYSRYAHSFKLDIGHSKILNMISSATFGVYLIHDNLYMRPFLWERVFKNASYVNSRLLIPFSLIVVFVVFSGCSIIELGRIYLIENNIDSLIRKIELLIDYKIKPIVSDKITDLLEQ